MSPTSYVCKGCGETIETKDDLAKESRRTRPAWKCRYCQTSIAGIVAEKIKHQT